MPFEMGEQPVGGAAQGGVVSEEGRSAEAAAWLADIGQQVSVLLFLLPLGYSVQPVFCVFYILSFSGLNFLFCGGVSGQSREAASRWQRERCLPLGCALIYEDRSLRALPNGRASVPTHG